MSGASHSSLAGAARGAHRRCTGGRRRRYGVSFDGDPRDVYYCQATGMVLYVTAGVLALSLDRWISASLCMFYICWLYININCWCICRLCVPSCFVPSCVTSQGKATPAPCPPSWEGADAGEQGGETRPRQGWPAPEASEAGRPRGAGGSD